MWRGEGGTLKNKIKKKKQKVIKYKFIIYICEIKLNE